MDYQLAATIFFFFAPTLAQEIKNGFLNPPIGNMPITEENGRITIGAS